MLINSYHSHYLISINKNYNKNRRSKNKPLIKYIIILNISEVFKLHISKNANT